jgi:hypothetical protein
LSRDEKARDQDKTVKVVGLSTHFPASRYTTVYPYDRAVFPRPASESFTLTNQD